MQYYIHFIWKLNSLIYIFTFEAGNLIINDSPLVKAMENGKVFIADEFNLAEDTILQIINISLEPVDENLIFLIPDTGKKIKRNNRFFFIACQNDLSTSGRKRLPNIIQKRLRTFEYPSPEIKDLQNSIEEMTKFEKIEKIRF